MEPYAFGMCPIYLVKTIQHLLLSNSDTILGYVIPLVVKTWFSKLEESKKTYAIT